MDTAPVTHSASLLLSLGLVFWTGSALYAALHPQSIQGIIRAMQHSAKHHSSPLSERRIRMRALGLGVVGFVLLAVPLLHNWL